MRQTGLPLSALALLLAPSIHTAGPLLDGNPPLRDDNTVVRNPEEARAQVLAQAEAGYDFIKVYDNLSEKAYRAVLEAAAERGLRVAGHLPRGVTAEEALRSGHPPSGGGDGARTLDPAMTKRERECESARVRECESARVRECESARGTVELVASSRA